MIVKVTQSIDDQVEPYQHAEEDKSMTVGIFRHEKRANAVVSALNIINENNHNWGYGYSVIAFHFKPSDIINTWHTLYAIRRRTDPVGLQREYYEYDYEGDIFSLSYICPEHQNLVISFNDNFLSSTCKENLLMEVDESSDGCIKSTSTTSVDRLPWT